MTWREQFVIVFLQRISEWLWRLSYRITSFPTTSLECATSAVLILQQLLTRYVDLTSDYPLGCYLPPRSEINTDNELRKKFPHCDTSLRAGLVTSTYHDVKFIAAAGHVPTVLLDQNTTAHDTSRLLLLAYVPPARRPRLLRRRRIFLQTMMKTERCHQKSPQKQ